MVCFFVLCMKIWYVVASSSVPPPMHVIWYSLYHCPYAIPLVMSLGFGIPLPNELSIVSSQESRNLLLKQKNTAEFYAFSAFLQNCDVHTTLFYAFISVTWKQVDEES